MNITHYAIEEIKDPTGIMEGQRYEALLDFEVDEEDELFEEGELYVRAIIAKNGDDVKLVQSFIIRKSDEQILDFALEEGEEQEVVAFCREKLLTDEI